MNSIDEKLLRYIAQESLKILYGGTTKINFDCCISFPLLLAEKKTWETCTDVDLWGVLILGEMKMLDKYYTTSGRFIDRTEIRNKMDRLRFHNVSLNEGEDSITFKNLASLEPYDRTVATLRAIIKNGLDFWK